MSGPRSNHTPDGPGRPARIPPRALVLGLLVLTAAAGAGGLWSYVPDFGLSASWAYPALALLTLAHAWDGLRLVAGRLLRLSAGVIVPFVVVGAALGHSPAAAAWMAVVNVAAALAILATYHRVRTGESWFPGQPRDVLVLAGLAVLGSALVVALGGVPGSAPGGTGTLRGDVWWLVRIQVILVYSAYVGFALLLPRERSLVQVRYRAALPLVSTVGLACLALPYLLPDYPLAWLLCVPAAWIGITLTPRLAALAAIVVSLVPSVFGRSGLSQAAEDGWLPPLLVMEVVLSCAAVLAFLLIVFREQAERLAQQAQEAFERESAENVLLGSVFASMTDGVLLTDDWGRVVVSNPAARSLLGQPRPTLDGGPEVWLSAYGLTTLEGEALDEATVSGLTRPPFDTFAQATVRTPAVEGRQERVYRISARALRASQDGLNLVIVTDATAAHERRRELEAFAGTVAHDLRNPLASLTLWMDVADSELEDDPDSGAEALRRARESSRRMSDLIDDYLAYTVTRQGALRVGVLPLGALAREVCASFEAAVPAPVIRVDAEATVQADRALVRQLLANLVGNSVKYGRPGGPVHITVRARPADEPGWVTLEVSDDGVGVRPEELEDIFKPFVRTASGTTTSQGTGLGLTLCQTVVERHGGRIRARGNDAGGLTIEATLPLAEALVP